MWKYWWVWWIISTIWWRRGPCRRPNFNTSWYLITQIDVRWWHFPLRNLNYKRLLVLKCEILKERVARRLNLKSVSGELVPGVGLGWVACRRRAISRVCPSLIVQIHQLEDEEHHSYLEHVALWKTSHVARVVQLKKLVCGPFTRNYCKPTRATHQSGYTEERLWFYATRQMLRLHEFIASS